MSGIDFHSRSEEDTLELARALGALLVEGDVVALYGDLGAGKTLFCKGVGEAQGVPSARIVSPSFTIVGEHAGRVLLFHVDAYRLGSERQAEEAGLGELLGGAAGICLVEWADRVENLLPNGCIRVRFSIFGERGRMIRVESADGRRLRRLAARCERLIGGGKT